MTLIIEERPDCLAQLKEEFEGKEDVVIVTTRIAGFILLNAPGRDYQMVFYNGMQVIGKKAIIMEKINVDEDFRI